ncbi:GspH/FimT family pseudopilin [Pseudohongiella nitratireducens]|nr:GspH/FimT family pseudopilin [Pseudohongiella nitratireducens]MDF1623376.1 GspH/FimT family pseudopilin [Pseudohongiella nitratireducens]
MQNHGWTLIELLIVLAIITTLTALSLPQADYSSRLTSRQQLQRLADGIRLARSEAILLGKPVRLCGLEAGQTARCADDWNTGFSILAEGDVIFQHRWQFNGRLTWQGFNRQNYLTIDERGMLRYQNGSFTYCPADLDKTKAQQLIINSAGRTRLAIDSDQDGIRETSSGTPITCHQ